MFLAGVPNFAKKLNTTPNEITSSLSALLLGNALSQLVSGPLSDRYGPGEAILLGSVYSQYSRTTSRSKTLRSLWFGIGWAFPQSTALALQPFVNSAGRASASLDFDTIISSAGMRLLLSFVTHNSAIYLATTMFLSGLFSFLVNFYVLDLIKYDKLVAGH